MATYRHWSVSLWRDPDDVSHCRILSPDKTEWRLISATLCGWRRCFMADQLWLMTRIREEEEEATLVDMVLMWWLSFVYWKLLTYSVNMRLWVQLLLLTLLQYHWRLSIQHQMLTMSSYMHVDLQLKDIGKLCPCITLAYTNKVFLQHAAARDSHHTSPHIDSCSLSVVMSLIFKLINILETSKSCRS